MDRVRFLSDHRSAWTKENLFRAGEEWCFERGISAALVGAGIAELVEADAETVSPEGQPGQVRKARAKAGKKPAP